MGQIIVAVGTESELKLRAVDAAFAAFSYSGIYAKLKPCTVESGVPAQPVGLFDMKKGATNRARSSYEKYPTADFAVGIESGLVPWDSRWFDVIYVLVVKGQEESPAVSEYFPIPAWMSHQARKEGSELGTVVQGLVGGGEKDAMKYLSRGMVRREAILKRTLVCALMPLVRTDRYRA